MRTKDTCIQSASEQGVPGLCPALKARPDANHLAATVTLTQTTYRTATLNQTLPAQTLPAQTLPAQTLTDLATTDIYATVYLTSTETFTATSVSQVYTTIYLNSTGKYACQLPGTYCRDADNR